MAELRMDKHEAATITYVLFGWTVVLCGAYVYFLDEMGVNSDILKILKSLPVMLLSFVARGDSLTKTEEAQSYSALVSFGLLLSSLGDYFIGSNFLAGVGFFAMAHIAYIGAFKSPASVLPFIGRTVRIRNGINPWLRRFGTMCWMILSFTAYSYFENHVPEDIRSHFAAYSTVISLMVWRAAVRDDGLGYRSYFASALGAFLFMASDIVLAQNRFVQAFDMGKQTVMTLYYTGQLLIAYSTMHFTYKTSPIPQRLQHEKPKTKQAQTSRPSKRKGKTKNH